MTDHPLRALLARASTPLLGAVRISVLSIVLSGALAAPAQSQTIADLMAALGRGGGWVKVDIKGGEGTLETVAVPTGGLIVQGFFQIWDENPGTWSIAATDLIAAGDDGGPQLEVDATAGERIPFRHQTGMMARLRVDVRWSEPLDTTLWIWVGLGENAPSPTSGSG